MATPNYDRLVSLLNTFGRFKIDNTLQYIGNYDKITKTNRIFLDSFINDNGSDNFFISLRNLVKDIDLNREEQINLDIGLKDDFNISNLQTNNINNFIYLLSQNSNNITGKYSTYYTTLIQLVDFYSIMASTDYIAYRVTIFDYINIPKKELCNRNNDLFVGDKINMSSLRYIDNATTTKEIILNHAWLCELLINETKNKEDIDGAKYFYRTPKIFIEMMRLFFNSILQMFNIAIIQHLINKLKEKLNSISQNPNITFKDMDEFSINYKNYNSGGSLNVISNPQSPITDTDFITSFKKVGKMLDDIIFICESNVKEYDNKITEYENNTYNIRYRNTKDNLHNVNKSMTITQNMINSNHNIIDMYSSTEFVYKIAYYIAIIITAVIFIGILSTLTGDDNNKIRLIILTLYGLCTFVIVFYIIENFFIMNMFEEFNNQIDSITKMIDSGIRYLVHISEHSFYEKTLLPSLNKEYKLYSNIDINKRFSYEYSKTYINDMLHNIIFFSSFTYFIISLCIIIMITYILYLSMPDNQLLVLFVFILLFVIIISLYIWNITKRKRNTVKHSLWKKPKYNSLER